MGCVGSAAAGGGLPQTWSRRNGPASVMSPVAACTWTTTEVWVHGELPPGNLLLVDGRLSAVIDFGGMTVGGPAFDLRPALASVLVPRILPSPVAAFTTTGDGRVRLSVRARRAPDRRGVR